MWQALFGVCTQEVVAALKLYFAKSAEGDSTVVGGQEKRTKTQLDSSCAFFVWQCVAVNLNPHIQKMISKLII